MLDKKRRPKTHLSDDEKRNNPQTNGKIERWFQEYRRHRWRFDTAYAFAEWYNDHVPGALDLDYFETPNDAFIWKMRSENTLGMFFERCEREVRLCIRNVL